MRRDKESVTVQPGFFRSPAIIYRCALCLALALNAASSLYAADEPGTVGLGLVQLYSDQQANKRGVLVVVQVVEGLPAAKAGIQRGDLVVTVNGAPVGGRELPEILRKDIHGPVGSELRLTVLRIGGNQSDLVLTRVPYPPRTNPASDPFAYSIPGQWTVDPRYSFPLPWAPALSYHGVEDLAFTPNFDDTSSPEYHSYLFFWWVEGTNAFTAQQLESDMAAYFRGLAEERGKNYNFTPDLSKISAKYNADSAGSRTFGGAPAKSFTGAVNIYDTHGKVITLNSEVVAAACPGSNHTAFFFGMSREPRDQPIWRQLDAVRDSFRCRR